MTIAEEVASLGKPVIRSPRTTSLDVHAHLRELIITGSLPPGTVLKQAELARAFEVSRTPLREAFRMLQEEGLIDADLNQRARVRGLDPDELDTLYASRLALEALGARVTTGRLSSSEVAEATTMLEEMETARRSEDRTAWLVAHRRFHHICTARARGPMAKAIANFAEQSERYMLIFQTWHPDSFSRAHREHKAILRAVCGSDSVLAGSLMAEHLSHTALVVLQDLDAERPASATREALAMATGTHM